MATNKFVARNGVVALSDSTITGSLDITGNLTTTGTITAQTLNVQQVTSSVVYSSGSNVFGNSLENTQSLIGSVNISGSLNVNGTTANLASYVPNTRTLSINGISYDLSANRSWEIAAGVTSFNTRTGAITLSSGDVTTALGYTPYNSTNPNGYTSNTGTVTSVSGTGTVSGLTLSGTVTTSGNLTLGGTLSLTSGQVTTALGFTPYNSTNPSGYTTNTGTVTSVSGTGTVSGLTLSGTVTSTGNLTLGGTLTLTSGQVTTALGYTPYNSTNPSGYITSAALSSYVPYGNWSQSTGMNDIKLYLRTNGDNNHYLWNAADDWEELNAYEGTGFRITSTGGSTGVLYVYGSSNGGYTYSPYSFRSPIFYDSNNTAYYLDPASTSNLNGLTLPNIDIINGTSYNENIRMHPGSNDFSSLVLGATAGTTGTGAGQWTIVRYPTATYSNKFTIRHFNTDYMEMNTSGNTTFITDVRSPIFYDSNNTAYYIDPTGTARLSYVAANGGVRIDGNEDLYLDHNYGQSVVGVYSSHRYQGVYSMGNAYKLPKDGTTTGNLYGIAWSHPNAGGAAGNLASHGMLILENGGFQGAWGGGSLRTPGDIRGTIYYDWNNTGYYLDPTSTTSLRTVGSWRADSSSWDGEFSGKIQYHSSHWYFQAAGLWIWRNAGGSNVIEGNQSGELTATGNVRSPIFYDSNNTGYYVDPASTSNLSGLTVANTISGNISGNSSTTDRLYPFGAAIDNTHPGYGLRAWYDWAYSGTYRNGISLGSNPGDQSYGWQLWQNMWDDRTYTRRYNGGWQSTRTLLTAQDDPYAYNMNQYVRTSDSPTFSTVYAQIFYDSNNTGRYIDPSGYSYVGGMDFNGNCNCLSQFQTAEGATMYLASNTWNIWKGYGWGTLLDRNSGDPIMYLYGMYASVGSISDIRYKKNVTSLPYGLNEVLQLNPIKYNYDVPQDDPRYNDTADHLGLSAQEVQDIIPEAVHTMKGKDMLAMTYLELIPVLVNAIKEQNILITNLQTEVEQLKTK